MDEYIERERLLRRFNIDDMMNVNGTLISLEDARNTISNFPAADVVPIEALKKWLWKVALNNSNNYLGDACEELVSRLDGLRRYVQDGGAKMDEEDR